MTYLIESLLGRFAIGSAAVILIGVLIWYAGPLLELGGYAPLESEWIRFALIGAVVLVFALVMLVSWLRARRRRVASASVRRFDRICASLAPSSAEVRPS